MLKNDAVVKIVSIVLAICLWAFVIGEVNPTIKKTIDDIPVELTNVDTLAERDLALGSDEEYFAEIVVEGSRSELNALTKGDIHVTADLYGYEEGENHVSVDVILPDGISLEENKTPEITVILEELTAISVPVTVEFVGETADGIEASYNSIVPAEVEVRGAKSVVSKVDSVRVQLDVRDLSEQWETYTAVPTAWNKKGKIVKNVTISATAVEVSAILYHTKQVPLELKVTGSPDEKYGEAEITIPKEVEVRGTADSLDRITSVAAESVDISDIKKSGVIEVSVNLPYGVELADSSKDIGVKIEFK